MDNKTLINRYFESIKEQLGFQVFLGGNNLCNIRDKSTGTEFTIELPNNGKHLHFYSSIASVPFENKENFFEFLLKLNLHGMETTRGFLGIDAQTNKVIYSRICNIHEVDESFLFSEMDVFLKTIYSLKEKANNFFLLPKTKSPTSEINNLNFVV